MDLEERIARLIDPDAWAAADISREWGIPVERYEQKSRAAARRVIDGLNLDIISSHHSLDGHRHRMEDTRMTATIDDVRQELEDLAAWRSGLSDAVDTILGISSPRLSTDGRGTSNGLALPFHLDQAVDEPDLGGAGVRTEAGLLDLLGSWAHSIAHDRGEHVKGSPLTYLHTTLQWAQENADWDGLAGDVHDAWVAVGRIVGHGDQVIADCPVPNCHGKIRARRRDKEGVEDFGWCDTCEGQFHTDTDAFREDARRVGRDTDCSPEAAVTIAQIGKLWAGEITADNIKKWVKWGKVIRCESTPSTYSLRTINRLATELVQRRARQMHMAERRISA